ncbi:CAP domain-containing protein [Cohnella sp. GCM10027633]|uniref:CAP domain-containing protein n=1 Tax=unclassified Cohnella TaxID=2636738 RepID=UPI0036330C5A
MNKQPNKRFARTLALGAMALTLSLPIGAAGAFAATNKATAAAPAAQTTVRYNFDLNAFLQQYMQSYYNAKPVTKPAQPSKPVTTPTQPSKPVTTAPTQPSQGTGTVSTSEFATQVVTLVNQERAKAGLKPLATTNSTLKLVALDKAKDMYNNNYFDHNSPTYGSPFDMMKRYGVSYRAAGENIAKGQRSPAEVMNAWMNSPGHRANILNASFTTIGVAYYNGVWVQEFIG